MSASLRLPRVALQAAVRGSALLVPLVITALARVWFTDLESALFFKALTFSVVLSSVFKFGIDLYIPQSPMSGGQVLIDNRYFRCLQGFLTALFALSAVLYAQGEGRAVVVLVACLSAQSALVAELSRANNNFFGFYFLKAPPAYAVVFFLVAEPLSPIMGALLLAGFYAALMCFSLRYTLAEGKPESTSFFLLQFLISIVVVLFSWKESVFLTRSADPLSLEIATFYTRLKIAALFFFSLSNARVPNIIRAKGWPKDIHELLTIIRANLFLNLAWAVGFTLIVTLTSVAFEPKYTLEIFFLLLPAIIASAFGNIIPLLNSYAKYRVVLFAHLMSIITFACSGYLLTLFLSPLLSVGLSGVCAQLVLGGYLLFGLKKRFFV